jgi:predicted ArsR family transcriptional regulator
VQPVRQRITEILKEQQTATVAELAEQLSMAQVSVRHHLDILVGQDLVETTGVRRRNGAGRPSQIYALTQEAVKLFPKRHDVLASDMLVEMKSILPPADFRSLLERMGEKTSRKAPTPRPEQTVEERLDEITRFLTKHGYDAKWELVDGHYELYTGNCPYAGVADHHPELCTMDQTMIQQLWPGATRRETRVLDGAHRCSYVISIDMESSI